jgi:hypothetical protein
MNVSRRLHSSKWWVRSAVTSDGEREREREREREEKRADRDLKQDYWFAYRNILMP